MSQNTYKTMMEQAVPSAALIEKTRNKMLCKLPSPAPAPRLRRRLLTPLAATALCLLFVVTAAAVANLFDLRDLLLPATDPGQTISLQGVAGTPEHAAAVAWQTFLNEYDLDATLANVGNIVPLDVPSEYLIYGAYSMEMVEKIREITARYNLNLLGELTETFPRTHDLESVNQWLFLNPGYHFSSGTFNIQGRPADVPFSLRASSKGVFDYVFLNIGDYADYSEWVYENEHGNQLLLLQSEYKSLIFFDAEEAFFAVNISAGTHGNDLDSSVRLMGRVELEAFADSIDFGRLWADSRAVFEPAPAAPTPAPPAVPVDGADAIMAQMEGNWVWHFGNPDNATLMNLFADGTWESPGPLPTDHTMGGSFELVSGKDGVYRIRFTVQESSDPNAELGHVFDNFEYNPRYDRLEMILHSGEGVTHVSLWRE